MIDDYRCPNCGALRDSPVAACDRCPYDPSPAVDVDPPGANPTRPGLGEPAPAMVALLPLLLMAAVAVLVAVWLVTDVADADRAILAWRRALADAVGL